MVDLDGMVESLRRGETLTEAELKAVCDLVKDILIEENNVQHVAAPVTVCGDIHGQFADLLELFRVSGEPPETSYIFLGDYVDRGRNSVETIHLLLCLKARYPDRITLLRGNHESRQISQVYGFYEESLNKYGSANAWKWCIDVFDHFTISCLVDEKIFCVHGGLSPLIRTVDQVHIIDRVQEVPQEGPFCHLLWSDPDDAIEGWNVSPRGAGFTFGSRVVEEFNHINDLAMVARAHQLIMEGYKFHFNKQLVTVWSAPNYCFRADDHQLLTSAGWLGLAQIQARIGEKGLAFCGYDPREECLVYEAATDLIVNREIHQELVAFGGKGDRCGAGSRGRAVSAVVTPDHDMYARAEGSAAFEKRKAKALLAEGRPFRLLCAAKGGLRKAPSAADAGALRAEGERLAEGRAPGGWALALDRRRSRALLDAACEAQAGRRRGAPAPGGRCLQLKGAALRDQVCTLAMHAGLAPRCERDARQEDLWRVHMGAEEAEARPALDPKAQAEVTLDTCRTFCVTMPSGFVVARRLEGDAATPSAPLIVGNCYRCGNAGSVMKVSADLQTDFVFFDHVPITEESPATGMTRAGGRGGGSTGVEYFL